ncbi:unnamed protein product [Urochloa humidicola]
MGRGVGGGRFGENFGEQFGGRGGYGGRFGGGYGEFYGGRGGGRHFQNFGGGRRGNFQGGRSGGGRWMERGEQFQSQQFDLRDNLNQAREETNKTEETTQMDTLRADDNIQSETKNVQSETENKSDQKGKGEAQTKEEAGKKQTEKGQTEGCNRCGRFGHNPEDCFRPVICRRCKQEGHVARACNEKMPWEYIAPFCGFAAPGQGFYTIPEEDHEDMSKDMASCALITIKNGTVSAKQLETEFKAQAGPQSTWRWFAKKVGDNAFQMRFPTVKKVEDLAFFTSMEMRTVPGVYFKVDHWNPHAGAKAKLEEAWFRIFNIPPDRRSEKVACYIASFVGIPMEVDKGNLKRWDYVRVKIGCKEVAKVPATVEGLLDLHLYDFTFQREVYIEGTTNAAGTKWVRNDRPQEENPSPKKPRWNEGSKGNQNSQAQAGPSNTTGDDNHQHKKVNGMTGETEQKEVTQQEEEDDNLERMESQEAEILEKANSSISEEGQSSIHSSEPGLCFDDIISPGGEHYTFGTFQKVEIKSIWRMHLRENRSAIINEYGSNLYKYKSDPLVVLEAKQALFSNGENEKQQFYLHTIQEDIEEETAGEITVEDTESQNANLFPSPSKGTQEAPAEEWSSQEECKMLEEEQSKQKEQQKSSTSGWEDEMVCTQDIQDGSLEEEEMVCTQEAIPLEKDIMKEDGKEDDSLIQEQGKQRQEQGQMETGIRQSERVKAQGQGQLKVAEKAEALAAKRNLEELQKTEDAECLEKAAQVIKSTALMFHPKEAAAAGSGVVLLQ